MEREFPGQRLQDGELFLVGVRDAEVEHLIEAAWAQKSLVQEVRAVSGADDEDAASTAAVVIFAATAHAVELSEELADDAVHDAPAVALVAALGRDAVELVEEDDAGAGVARALEDAADVGFRLADVHVEQLGAFDAEEVEAEFGGDGFGEEGFAGAGGAVEEDAAAFFHAFCEELGAGDGELDGFHDGGFDGGEAADVAPCYRGDFWGADAGGEGGAGVGEGGGEVGGGEGVGGGSAEEDVA